MESGTGDSASYLPPTEGSRTSVDFLAYADDYVVRGEILLRYERLADELAAAEELRVEAVTVRALEDGREHQLPFAAIERDELCAVVATGPRGNARLRLRTRPYPVRAQVGPYAVVGYLHAMPTADPFAVAQRRHMIALSPARLSYLLAGDPTEESHDCLLLVRARVRLLESASDEDVGLSEELELLAKLDPSAKDMTGEVMGETQDA